MCSEQHCVSNKQQRKTKCGRERGQMQNATPFLLATRLGGWSLARKGFTAPNEMRVSERIGFGGGVTTPPTTPCAEAKQLPAACLISTRRRL